MNHTELPFDEILERRMFQKDIPKGGQLVCQVMQDGWEIGMWIENEWEGAGPVAKKILAVNDLIKGCKLMLEAYAPLANFNDRVHLHSAMLAAHDALVKVGT